MKRIVQYFNRDEIKALAFEERIYCLKTSNELGKMDLVLLRNITPTEINKLLEDDENMFIVFTKEKE